ncbi:hypothetical protein NDU88_000556 [Pleurodeles waltl]|uniref:Uncharacterized protein n=1 Tax=Pleurodeles waltl TaxID=8319 RepID=A0AAV7LUY8_PLEWA|nr:hypothetical protein NDU88_000556 [Pleurodeles waltl]
MRVLEPGHSEEDLKRVGTPSANKNGSWAKIAFSLSWPNAKSEHVHKNRVKATERRVRECDLNVVILAAAP